MKIPGQADGSSRGDEVSDSSLEVLEDGGRRGGVGSTITTSATSSLLASKRGEEGKVAGLPGCCLRRSGGGGVESPFL